MIQSLYSTTPGYSLVESYPSAEIQSVSSAVQADWTSNFMVPVDHSTDAHTKKSRFMLIFSVIDS